MGIYYNPGNSAFQDALNSEIYVDKSGLLEFTNRIIDTKQKLLCVSRPRRFGKSMAAEMLMAYYSRGCDSGAMFQGLKIASSPSFHKHLNQYDVLYLDIQNLWSTAAGKKDSGHFLDFLQQQILKELYAVFPRIVSLESDSLPETIQKISAASGKRFIFIIDEWDCIFREAKDDSDLQKAYILFLRSLFKGTQAEDCIHLAYMTGILPIKKYGTQSALNNFSEYTMINPGPLTEYTGFTEDEVRNLCSRYHMDFETAQQWYDGYRFRRVRSIYNPRSVVEAMINQEYGNYWTGTETYEALKLYIDMDFDGLKAAVLLMLGGNPVRINPQKFQNDMTSIKSKDDVMTLLIHLGYLACDSASREVYIPNQEIADEFENAIEDTRWGHVADALRQSEELLKTTWRGDTAAMSAYLDQAHEASSSILAYNNELSLSCVITIAYYSAKKDYTLIRELPSGKGFADIAFLPRRSSDKLPMLVELKWDHQVKGALRQIKDRNYTGVLEEYEEILLVGISYDKKKKIHHCVTEKWNRT